MRLLLDENVSRKRFRRALELAGHDVEVVVDVLGSGTDDGRVAAYAMSEGRTLVTGDQDDFLEHYRDVEDHPGLILIYPSTRGQGPGQLARAIDNIAGLSSKPSGLVLSLNDFIW
jgi:hypothetical protein